MQMKLHMPQWGMGITEGTLLRWLKNTGDEVKQGEPLAEIETAKAVQEFEAPVNGVLHSVQVAEGETVPVRTQLAIIETNS